MAVVYMAEQTEPIRRKVALKIIKLGMDTRQVIARFEVERQALALMDHPSIAKVLDAGATETGRPYFVMELVTGVSITEYCDQNSLSTKDRLALFLQVCSAVQHAHQKGIIHRDLKPSNVMVTHHDGKPMPKVIDFGIAKATDQKLTEKTLFTRYAHIIGTPAYMSPEQAELSDLDIDTRTDIYSLGVLLYELLTGTTPFSEEELRKAGYLEMQRVIREQEPVKPSTKLSTLGETLTDIAKLRSSTPDLLRKAVRGDLDWIVMKSLEKDRTRRYDTPNALASDILRHLEHEPVLARGPSTTYRLHKFLRRHRVQALVGLTVGVLVGVVAILLALWNRDRLQLAEAEGFRHRGILSQAREQYARADRESALETIKPVLESKHVGAEARLLQAGILVDNRRSEEAVNVLNSLVGARPEVAGAAHSLLARILWESESLDAEKLREIEEHRRQAEALLAETAEAYFLRAMTAITVKEQLASLDKALELDAKHYESRRLRAFTYYASRKYERLNEDAVVMETLRDRDPLGYSLRATALRELSRYTEAIAEYDKAISLTAKGSPQYLDLAIQRCEVFLRMGDYERVVSEAQASLRLWADKAVFQYYSFCALTALGEYDKADSLFQEIIQSASRDDFRLWVTKHVLDTLQAGRSWHPPDSRPIGRAFLPMVEVEEVYDRLSAKCRRIVSEGFSAQQSPDGKKLAFSLGVEPYSGVAIFDLATKETDLLTVPGKDPRWSPDGRYIAFVRHPQALPLEQLAGSERRERDRWPTDEEVWVIRSDGTGPRRLALGGWPSWSHDSTRVYYHSHLDNMFCSISIADRSAAPEGIMACPSSCPSISPDGERLAYLEDGSLKVKDLASQRVIAEWPAPPAAWAGPGWSPTGDELCLGGRGDLEDRTGLWIYRLGQSEPTEALGGQITAGSWAPDGTKLVFNLGSPYFGIWAADLDPEVSTLEALGPARTIREHFQEVVALHTRRIDADPADAGDYLRRAEQYQFMGEAAKMRADMRRHDAILKRGFCSDSGLAGPWTLMRAVEGPFGCQLVLFAERQEDGIHVLRIAFGQKGRWQMKSFEIPMFVTSLLGLCFLSGLDTPAARGDFIFGKPTNLGASVNSSGHEFGPCVSPDGLELYFTRGDPGDIWVARRPTPNSEWGVPANLGPIVNSFSDDGRCRISADGLSLYFDSTRPGGFGGMDLWRTTRATKEDNWVAPTNLGPVVNSGSTEVAADISADGLELYFTSDRPGGYGNQDLWVTRRATVNDDWGTPTNLGSTVNSSTWDDWSSISADGLVLIFVSERPGGYGSGVAIQDLYMTRRTTTKDPWGHPMNLGLPINSMAVDHGPMISLDGSTLYFDSLRPGGVGGVDLWQVPISRVLDFHGDGKVDAADLALLAANWGKNNSLCDIGPFPWGDGVVDEKDLRVLMESLMTPGPHASDVPCDVVLSWISPSFAKTHDVYIGTSREAVETADRDNPQNVLVSLGQTATTYDPAELLEYSRTYYWRVDFVIPGPTPTIYPGPVLDFTTEAFAYPIKNITGTASSAQRGMEPAKTVDGSGLDKNDGHSTNGADMWLSQSALPQWIQYQFDTVHALHELWVWNSNQPIEPFLGFGAKTVKIEYSTDGTTWTLLNGVPEFARASGQLGYTPNTKVSFGGVSAKYVKLIIEKSWGATPSTGLSEVRFFYIPDRSVAKP
jgi:Tol biopolymer transport system component/tetratricopeptide (TPR) repeat protein